MVNGFDRSWAGDLQPATRELIERRDRALGGAYRLFYDHPVSFVHGAGVHLYDADGKAYLDAYNNVPSVGHSHPYVAEAVTKQLATLNTHTRYLTDGGCRVRRAVARHAHRRPGYGRVAWARDLHVHRE